MWQISRNSTIISSFTVYTKVKLIECLVGTTNYAENMWYHVDNQIWHKNIQISIN